MSQSYVVLGAYGGIGEALTRRLARRGARTQKGPGSMFRTCLAFVVASFLGLREAGRGPDDRGASRRTS